MIKIKIKEKESKPVKSNPFTNKNSKINLLSTLPTPLVPTRTLHPKISRVSTQSNYSLQFPQNSSFVQNNLSSALTTSRSPFASSSFHIQHKKQNTSRFCKENEIKFTQSHFQGDNLANDIFKNDKRFIRTISDPFGLENHQYSQPSSQNQLLMSTDANISMISSTNCQSIKNPNYFTSSILNDSRAFNIISPNNLMMMPLGSISNETRVNIYSRKKQINENDKINTGRPNLKIVKEEKKNFTSCRQRISGNSLTELLTGNRQQNNKQTPLKIKAKNEQKEVWSFYKKIQKNKQKDTSIISKKKERGKIAKSQPKLNRQRSYISTSEIPRNRAKYQKKIFKQNTNYFKNLAKKENKLFQSFKKESKENKIVGINQNNFKKKRSIIYFLIILSFNISKSN